MRTPRALSSDPVGGVGRGPTRRQFLQGALASSSALLLGCGDDAGGTVLDGGLPLDAATAGDASCPPLPGAGPAPGCPDPFAGGTCVGRLEFTGESNPMLDTVTGEGLRGRLYHDLSSLTRDNLITPNEKFYLHTRYSDLLDPNAAWKISVSGMVSSPRDLSMADLGPLVMPMGAHLMECSGNGAFARYGMLSVAEWAGVPMTKLMSLFNVSAQATRVLVSGFDMYSSPPGNSVPGASWIFSFQQLADFGAFLATQMNGVPLPKDHGFPVRLLVPRWYGCTCVKWVNEIQFVDDTAPATSHMQEYASRTMQSGTPALAKDYVAASMDQSAMPVRVERWRVGGKPLYQVVGVMWGGARPTDKLQIRFNREEPWVNVNVCPAQSVNDPWTLWSHAWQPVKKGPHEIALRVNDPMVPQRRLDNGYYLRSVEVDEV